MAAAGGRGIRTTIVVALGSSFSHGALLFRHVAGHGMTPGRKNEPKKQKQKKDVSPPGWSGRPSHAVRLSVGKWVRPRRVLTPFSSPMVVISYEGRISSRPRGPRQTPPVATGASRPGANPRAWLSGPHRGPVAVSRLPRPLCPAYQRCWSPSS